MVGSIFLAGSFWFAGAGLAVVIDVFFTAAVAAGFFAVFLTPAALAAAFGTAAVTRPASDPIVAPVSDTGLLSSRTCSGSGKT